MFSSNFASIGNGIGTSTEVETKAMTHGHSLVLLHNDLMDWNESNFDELWNTVVEYKLTDSDNNEYGEVSKVIK